MLNIQNNMYHSSLSIFCILCILQCAKYAEYAMIWLLHILYIASYFFTIFCMLFCLFFCISLHIFFHILHQLAWQTSRDGRPPRLSSTDHAYKPSEQFYFRETRFLQAPHHRTKHKSSRIKDDQAITVMMWPAREKINHANHNIQNMQNMFNMQSMINMQLNTWIFKRYVSAVQCHDPTCLSKGQENSMQCVSVIRITVARVIRGIYLNLVTAHWNTATLCQKQSFWIWI